MKKKKKKKKKKIVIYQTMTVNVKYKTYKHKLISMETDRKKKRRYQKRRYSIQRNEDGSIQLPAQIVASLRIIELGRIDYERPAFHNDRYIFPIGYTAER